MFDKKHVSIGSFSGVRTASKSGTFRKFGGWKSGTVYERKFRSYRDFIDFINRGRPSGVKTQSTANKGMHYHNSWEEAMENVKSGWQEGREKVQEIIDSIDIDGVDMHGQRIEHSHDVMGQRMAMGRYMAGDPECFVTRNRVEDQTKSGSDSVQIKCNTSASGSISTEEFLRRGAACAALTEILEWVGIAVELVATKTTSLTDHKAVSYSVPIKRPEEPLNPDTLAFQLGNPDMLRRFFWGAEERDIPSVRNKIYGGPSSLQRYHEDPDTVFLGELRRSKFRDAEGIEEWVVEKLEEQGIDLS